MKKVIVVDCDNVLLDWEFAFDVYANSHGFFKDPTVKPQFDLAPVYRLHRADIMQIIREFNESTAIGFLPAVRDAYQYVRRLGEEGWRFHVVSSVSDDETVRELRTRNLEKTFGKVFDHIECLPIGASKKEYLDSNFANSGLHWVEDNPIAAEDGADVGLSPLIMAHNYNRNYTGRIRRVMHWGEIYQIVNNSNSQHNK